MSSFLAKIWPKNGKTDLSIHDVLEPLKQALLASRDVIISSQICGSKLQKVFTLGDGYCLPKGAPSTMQMFVTSCGCFVICSWHGGTKIFALPRSVFSAPQCTWFFQGGKGAMQLLRRIHDNLSVCAYSLIIPS